MSASKYVTVGVKMSPMQGRKLMDGMAIRLGKDKLVGDQEIHVTPTQAKMIAGAITSGKGCQLRFSGAQMSHHRVHGSGFFSRLWRGIKRVGKAVYSKAIKPVGKFALSLPGVRQAVDTAIQTGANVAGSTVGALSGNAALGNKVSGVASSVGNSVVNSVGSGRKRAAVKAVRAKAKVVKRVVRARARSAFGPSPESLVSVGPLVGSSKMSGGNGGGNTAANVVNVGASSASAARAQQRIFGRVSGKNLNPINGSSKMLGRGVVPMSQAYTYKKGRRVGKSTPPSQSLVYRSKFAM